MPDGGEGNVEEKMDLFLTYNNKKSLNEASITEQPRYKYSRWIIPETSTLKQIWDFYCLLLIIYICIVVPYRLAFAMEDTKAIKTISIVIDVSFLIDIFLQFFSAYFDEVNHRMVETHRDIATMYLKSWFIFDVLSIFPMEFVVSQFTKKSLVARANESIRIARITKVYKMTRFIRVLKSGNLIMRTKKTLKEQIKIDSGVLRINFFIGLCFLSTHLLSCIWIGMTSFDKERNWLTKKLT